MIHDAFEWNNTCIRFKSCEQMRPHAKCTRNLSAIISCHGLFFSSSWGGIIRFCSAIRIEHQAFAWLSGDERISLSTLSLLASLHLVDFRKLHSPKWLKQLFISIWDHFNNDVHFWPVIYTNLVRTASLKHSIPNSRFTFHANWICRLVCSNGI